jgi:hypothetical protein
VIGIDNHVVYRQVQLISTLERTEAVDRTPTENTQIISYEGAVLILL